MKYKVFDVVELKDNNKATILEVLKNGYRAEIVDENGITQSMQEIIDSDIKKIILKK